MKKVLLLNSWLQQEQGRKREEAKKSERGEQERKRRQAQFNLHFIISPLPSSFHILMVFTFMVLLPLVLPLFIFSNLLILIFFLKDVDKTQTEIMRHHTSISELKRSFMESVPDPQPSEWDKRLSTNSPFRMNIDDQIQPAVSPVIRTRNASTEHTVFQLIRSDAIIGNMSNKIKH